MGKFKDIDVIDAIKAMKTHIENGRMSLLISYPDDGRKKGTGRTGAAYSP